MNDQDQTQVDVAAMLLVMNALHSIREYPNDAFAPHVGAAFDEWFGAHRQTVDESFADAVKSRLQDTMGFNW